MPQRFRLDADGETFELGEAEFTGILFEVVTTLVFEKLIDRATFVLAASERELIGSGSSHFDPLAVSLYRHLKEQRCQGPSYPQLPGDAQSFCIHSIKDGLVAVAFFLRAGESVPHFTAGDRVNDVLTVFDRGSRVRLMLEDPKLLQQLRRLTPR